MNDKPGDRGVAPPGPEGCHPPNHQKRDAQWRISGRLVVIELARYVAKGDIELPTVRGLARKDRTDPSYAVLGS